MCTSSPKIPEAKQVQDATQVATLDQRRKARQALAGPLPGGTALTGPASMAPNTGASTLLGA